MAELHVMNALREKQSELSGAVSRLEQQLAQYRGSLAHLDATMRLFDPDLLSRDTDPAQQRERVSWFGPGECRRLIHDVLRDAPQPLATRELGRWCMEASADSTVPAPHGSATDGNGLRFADHAVECLNGKGDFAKLSGPAASAQLGPDQVLVAAHCRFSVIAFSIPCGPLPADAAPLSHELDVAVAQGLLVRISCAQHGVGPGWNDHLGRWPGLSGRGGLVDGVAIIGAVRGDAGQDALALAQQAGRLRRIVRVAVHQHVRFDLARAVQHQVHRPGARLHTRLTSGKGAAPSAQSGVVRHRQRHAEQLQNAAGEPFHLPQGQVEHEPQGEHQLDRQLRVARLPARRAAARCLPSCQRRLVHPDRQVTPPAQPRFVGRPAAEQRSQRARDPMSGLRDVMAARGVVLERHDRNIPVPPGSGYPGIHAPTPSPGPFSSAITAWA